MPKHPSVVKSEKLCGNLAKVLLDARTRSNLSQNRVGKAGALSPQMVGYVETQERCPSIDLYFRQAFGLGKLPSDLLKEAERLVGLRP